MYNHIDGAHKKMKLIPEVQLKDVHSPYAFKYVPPCGIYRFYDKKTGICYIGQSRDVWSRIARHLSEDSLLFSKSPFQQYIRECGMENLCIEILWYGKELKDENIRRHFEAYYIHAYDSTNPKKGWNKVQPGRFNFNLDDSRRIVEAHKDKASIKECTYETRSHSD